MNELRTKWIAKLRSGECKQAVGSLKTNTGYCCLGVAATVHPDMVETKTDFKDKESGFYSFVTLNRRIAEEFGIDNDLQDKLTQLNDKYHFSFERIAALLENGNEAIEAAYKEHAYREF